MYFHVEGEGVTLTEMQGGGSQLWETQIPVCPCWEQRGQRSADGGPLPVVSLNHVVLEQSYAPPLPAAAAVTLRLSAWLRQRQRGPRSLALSRNRF